MFFKNTRNFLFGFTVGFGTGFFARDLFPYAKELAKPTAKGIMKTSIRGFEKIREGLFRMGEVMEDLTAEVKVELKEEDKKEVPTKAERKKKPSRVTKRPPAEPIAEPELVEGRTA